MISIDVYSDVVCPWCFIGQRNLQEALAQFRAGGQGEADVNWHAFQLNPQLPATGMPRQRYIETKFGDAQRAAAIYARVAEAGRNAGIEFAFERIHTQPNTLDAHRLIDYARVPQRQQQVVTRLFEAFFLEGADLRDQAALAELAAHAGLDAAATRDYLASGAGAEAVRESDCRARAMGIAGVPFFIFDRCYAVSGAQPAQALLATLHQCQSQPRVRPELRQRSVVRRALARC